MKIVPFAALGAVLTGAALGLAAQASAELTDGQYEKTYLFDGRTVTVTFTSCGAGCQREVGQDPPGPVEYHLEGNTWTHTFKPGVTSTIDNDSLTGAFNSTGLSSGEFKLVKVN